MEKIILSLKNIYMLLMTEDFPIYSESVIGRNERKGNTMLRFWQGQIAEEFRCLPCGQMIWRNDGKRNRYTSYLCNRSAEIKTYSEYAKEIASQISVPALLNQISRFMEFLSSRKYRHDILLRRTRELMRLTEAEDPRVSDKIVDQIWDAVSWQSTSGDEKLFQAAYLLTLLMLYAAAGEAMDDAVMAVLREKNCGIEALWDEYTHPRKKESAVLFLTNRSGLLQDNPLPQHRFFGREEELFNLKEIASSGRKCMIRGIGGIGKTELLRQLIRICAEEKTVDKIAVVPYEGGIIESFARCFPGFQRQDPQESFHSVLYRLIRESEQAKVLLLIDNLTNDPEDDPALRQLAELPCGILITTRRTELEGFEVYSLDNPTIGTGSLIFRDNYAHPLGLEDQAALTGMLADEALCHPLTLRLMARAARNKGWSVQELKDQLERKNAFVWQEDTRTVHLSQVYHQLYSYMQIPEECRGIAELFTLLPRDSYSLDFLKEWFPDVLDSGATGKLEALTDGGWLDKDESGFSMHPLIAQCLRRKVITEERLRPMFQTILDRFALSEDIEDTVICDILYYVCQFLSGSISREWMTLVLAALCGENDTIRNQAQQLKLLEQMKKRCPDWDDLTELLLCTVQGFRRCGDAKQFEEFYRRQKEHLTVPKHYFLDFCIYAGESLRYMGLHDKAQELIQEATCEEATPFQKAAAYFHLIGCLESSGDSEQALYWAQQGAAFAAENPQCGKSASFRLLAMLCQMFIKFGRKESAAAVLKQIEEQELVQDSPKDKSQYDYMAGMYEMKFGDPEKALAHTQSSMRFTEEYEGRNSNYYLHQGQIAGILRAMERYEEALDVYKDLLENVQKIGDAMLIHLYSTNISTVHLALNQPEEALRHLETAMELATEMGGLALAETQRNRARAFGQLGDTKQEYACLKEASPLLDEAYGPDHPRSVAARQRLAELTQNNGSK